VEEGLSVGMYVVLNAVSDSNINAVLATPELIGGIMYKDDPDVFWEHNHFVKKKNL